MKKVLVICYYWPPAGGPGVQRVVKFTKLLPQFGWQPIVLTVENPVSPATDESLLQEIPPECIVHKTKAFQPFDLYRYFTGKAKDQKIPKDVIASKKNESIKEKVSRLVRANFFIPDARIGWIPFIVREGLKIIEKEKPLVIFSTSPPHSLQLGARKLARKSGLKWIADFRDPWSEAYWESEIGKSWLTRRINKYQEKKVLHHADLVTTVSDGIASLFSGKYHNRYEILHNGFGEKNTDKALGQRFKILFIGNLSKFQNPMPFIQAITSLPVNIRQSIDVIFVGRVFEEFRPGLQRAGVILKDYMPYKRLMEFSKTASLLLLIFHETSYTMGYITAKMFDYLSLRKPILAIGKRNSNGERVLLETESGELFEQQDVSDISEYIIKVYNQWRNKNYLLLDDNDALNEYSTHRNVEKLVCLFEEVINGSR